ncbi:NADH-quinone oxidoreductase subunit A [Buchnera aphidicola (Formosaphis micheliae)]|uniref:NADH-quinone oxidoreductase subunit A n=1 Tax=Buchnera aphidicola TaxID=9 RepID=UPI0031B81C40
MIINNHVYAQYWAFAVFIFGGFFISIFMLLLGYLCGGKSFSCDKHIPFESGINSVGNSYLRFSIQFYLIAMLFVIFDVEALYLYVWAIGIYNIGWIGFFEVLMFILTLLLGLFYVVRCGMLQWIKKY